MEKTGYMVYSELELRKNQAFVSLFQSAGKQCGISFLGMTFEQARVMPAPDFVLNRTRRESVSRWFEQRGIRVFHASLFTAAANDKFRTLCYLRSHLPKEWREECRLPATFFLRAEERQEVLGRLFFDGYAESRDFVGCIEELIGEGKDLVLKTVDGHGGSEVVLLPAAEGRQCRMEKMKRFLPGKNLILQERIQSEGRDLRVYIVGGQIYASVLRTGVGDFRSNYSLGGKAELYSLSEKERRLVGSVLDAFGRGQFAMAGIDFLVDRQGELIFNELEEMVGTRMLYQCSEKDIVKDFVAWLQDIV